MAVVVAVLNVPGVLIYVLRRPRETLSESYVFETEKPSAVISTNSLSSIYTTWLQYSTKAFLSLATIKEFVDLGFKAIVVCANAKLLDKSFVGRTIDHPFLSDLPQDVDPCGENGEFHSFVYDGPILSAPIPITIGEKVLRTYKSEEDSSWDNSFWYCDLQLKSTSQ